jgi:hypothetical protein
LVELKKSAGRLHGTGVEDTGQKVDVNTVTFKSNDGISAVFSRKSLNEVMVSTANLISVNIPSSFDVN